MKFPLRRGWLTNRRFVRTAIPLVAFVALALVLYNATAVDRVPPTITISIDKTEPNSTLALTRASIDVKFSEQVDQKSAEAAFSITPDIKYGFTWKTSQQLIVTPGDKLPLDTQFRVQMAKGVKDPSGNVAGAVEYTFTTVGPPKVVSISPAAGSKDVALDSTIQITFDRFMDPDAVSNALSITPFANVEAKWNGAVLTLTPAHPLQSDTKYSVAVSGVAVDTDGSHLPPYVGTFTTVGQGLKAVTTIPRDNVAGVSPKTPIAIVFDGPIDPASLSNAPFTITPPVSGTYRAAQLPDDRPPPEQPSPSAPSGNVLLFTPDQPLTPHTTYTVALKAGVHRTDGEVAAVQTWSFTTGEVPTSAQNQIVFLSDRDGVSNVWLMNPDGTNQRQVTTELVPVAGFDVSVDGKQLVYTAGGTVKRLTFGGDLQTITQTGRLEYAPSFTPDGNSIVLGRRDASGADQGYWEITLGLQGGEKQLTTDGAPPLGSVTLSGDTLTDSPGRPSWATRAAYSGDGKTLLLVRGDGVPEIIDLGGTAQPKKLNLLAEGMPVFAPSDSAFFLVASDDNGANWSDWRVGTDGTAAKIGAARGDVTATSKGKLAFLQPSADGTVHLVVVAATGSPPTAMTTDTAWSERSPSFSPDGSQLVFGRVSAQVATASAGIWVVKTDGTGLTNLATDGVYPRWLP